MWFTAASPAAPWHKMAAPGALASEMFVLMFVLLAGVAAAVPDRAGPTCGCTIGDPWHRGPYACIAGTREMYDSMCLAECHGKLAEHMCYSTWDQCEALRCLRDDRKKLLACYDTCDEDDVRVRGKTGRYYTNACVASCWNDTVVFRCAPDECGDKLPRFLSVGYRKPAAHPPPPTPPPPSCARKCRLADAEPVCSEAGKLYANPCMAKCAGAKVRFPCGKRKKCAVACRRASSN